MSCVVLWPLRRRDSSSTLEKTIWERHTRIIYLLGDFPQRVLLVWTLMLSMTFSKACVISDINHCNIYMSFLDTFPSLRFCVFWLICTQVIHSLSPGTKIHSLILCFFHFWTPCINHAVFVFLCLDCYG